MSVARESNGQGVIDSQRVGSPSVDVKGTRRSANMNEMQSTPVSVREREHDVTREIAHALRHATSTLELYRLALARITPIVRANFASVFVRDPADPALLKLECAQNWPQSSARYLSELRIRVGQGPTGRAVAEGDAVAAVDVFADESLREWWEPARELGFASLISLPLRTANATTGAITFYFTHAHEFAEGERKLLQLVAEQLSVAAARES